jgi:hypothetical protein
VPTKHRRLALVRDPEVDAALERARRALDSEKPDAALARELMLAGAEVLAPEPEDPFLAKLARTFKRVRPATMTMEEALRLRGPLPPIDPDEPYAGTRALEEQREDVV